MNHSQQDFLTYCNFTNGKQLAELDPENPNYYRTFFLQMDHIAKRARIRALSNWVYGEVPPHIQVAHPHHLAKIKSGNYYSYV